MPADVVKHRRIGFGPSPPDPRQAHTARALLVTVEGVLRVQAVTPQVLALCYDLRRVHLRHIEMLLTGEGLQLEDGPLSRLKRALIHYAEETQRANMGCPRGRLNCADAVYVHRYQRTAHGCRDPRPQHWRTYL